MKKRYTARIFEDLLQFLLPWSLTLVSVDTFCLTFLEPFLNFANISRTMVLVGENNENNL